MLFAIWGFIRTVPYLQTYKFDAIRDAALWGYGIVAVLIPAFIYRKEQIYATLHKYMKFLRWFLPISSLPLLITLVAGQHLPGLPWAGSAKIIAVKPGDVGVVLAGAALFLLLFPRSSRSGAEKNISMARVIQVIGWVLCLILVVVASRGGFLSIVMPIAMVSVLRPQKIGLRVASIGIAAVTLAVVLLELNPIPVKVKGHALNADEIANVLGSIGNDSAAATGHKGTERWRLLWWNKIIHYTILGPYRWTGKGFGINLAVIDGPPGIDPENAKLRSPHNANMTVLARMGVPGLFLWIAIQLTFAVRLIHAYRRSMRIGATSWASTYLWILGFWMASIINGSFDVYLEGPQGGILFWAIIGFGIAALRVGKLELRNIAMSQAFPSNWKRENLRPRALSEPVIHAS